MNNSERETSVPLNTESTPVRLEDALKKNEQYLPDNGQAFKKNARLSNDTPSVTLSSGELRKNFRTLVSGRLATGLWVLLGGVVSVHIIGVALSSLSLSLYAVLSDINIEENNSEVRKQLVEDSVALVDGSAKTLYSFLTPLATAITGYYFSAIETEVEQKRRQKDSSSARKDI